MLPATWLANDHMTSPLLVLPASIPNYGTIASDTLHGAVDDGSAAGRIAPLAYPMTPDGAFLDGLLSQLEPEALPECTAEFDQIACTLPGTPPKPIQQTSNAQPPDPSGDENDAIAPPHSSTAQIMADRLHLVPPRKATTDSKNTLVATTGALAGGERASPGDAPRPLDSPVAMPGRVPAHRAKAMPEFVSFGAPVSQTAAGSFADSSPEHQTQPLVPSQNAADQSSWPGSKWHDGVERGLIEASKAEASLPVQAEQARSLPSGLVGQPSSDDIATSVAQVSEPENDISIPVTSGTEVTRGNPKADQSAEPPAIRVSTQMVASAENGERTAPPFDFPVPGKSLAEPRERLAHSSADSATETGASSRTADGDSLAAADRAIPSIPLPRDVPRDANPAAQAARQSQLPDRFVTLGMGKSPGFRDAADKARRADSAGDGSVNAPIRSDNAQRTLSTNGETRALTLPIESEGTTAPRPMTGSIDAVVVRLASGKKLPPTRGSSTRIEPSPIAKSTEQTASAPLVSHLSTGPEPMANGLAAPPGSSAVATLAASNVADPLNESIAAWYARTPNEQGVRFELRLDPPELGRVVVRLQKSKGKVTAKLFVTNDAARVTVERDLPALQQSLEQAGVKLDQFDLTQHSGHQGRERSEGGQLPGVHWTPRGEVGMPGSTPIQMDELAADHVDLRV